MGKRHGAGKPADTTKNPMIQQSKNSLVALLALLTLPFAIGPAEGATASSPPASKRAAADEPIARIADRRVDEADIHRAALVMERDPLRTRQPALWRKKLLELCVDRELLALEAEREGFLNNHEVKRRVERESAGALYALIRDRILIPEISPTAAQLDTARAGGLYRRAKLGYILSLTDSKTTDVVLEALRQGASFDSMAALFSVHTSAPKGGHIGWRWVGTLNAQSWRPFKTAKTGDLLGPFSNENSHEIFRVEAIVDPSEAELRDKMMSDRSMLLDSRYNVGLLRKHGFKLNPEEVSSFMFAAATEAADSILASLDVSGRRPKQGVRPSLGVIASVDGDSITYRDIAPLLPRDGGKGRIEDTHDLLDVCTAALLPRLIARDARERGIDRDPAMARRLRLIREEASTRAMVAAAVPALDSAALRAYFESHAARYQRPAARRAMVGMFAAEDTARMAQSGWTRSSLRDSVTILEGFRALREPSVSNLFPRFYGEMSLFESDPDPLSVAVRALGEGQVSPVIPMLNGYAVALALRREASRAWRFEEVATRVNIEAREDAENTWVVSQLERLRAATPARTAPALLNAIRLGINTDMGGKRR